MRIAFFSPLSPLKTGVADYSEEILPYLSKYMKIDIYVDGYKPQNKTILEKYPTYNIEEFQKNNKSDKYNNFIFHIGNNFCHDKINTLASSYEGISVMHDYSLHGLIAAKTIGRNNWIAYIQAMKKNYGRNGEVMARRMYEGKRGQIWQTTSVIDYPFNENIVNNSKLVLVHSLYIKKLLENSFSTKAEYIPFPVKDIKKTSEQEKKKLKKYYGIENDLFIISSVGFISKHKRIESILQVLKELATKDKKFLYIIVGQELDRGNNLSKTIKELGLEKHVKITGYIDPNDFNNYIKMSDICLNLRYPSYGESSASLFKISGYGKPCVITDIGSFSELPDDCVIKIRYDNNEKKDLFNAINRLKENPDLIENMTNNVINYIEANHKIEKTAERYYDSVINLLV